MDKIASNKQQQKTNLTKKAVYATMIATPVIAVGIYTAVALSAGIVKFNPIVASEIFIGVAAFAVMCFATMKVCEKINEEKDNDPNISTCIAIKKVLVSECLKNSEVIVS